MLVGVPVFINTRLSVRLLRDDLSADDPPERNLDVETSFRPGADLSLKVSGKGRWRGRRKEEPLIPPVEAT